MLGTGLGGSQKLVSGPSFGGRFETFPNAWHHYVALLIV
jgi:hypothetical protein